MSAPKPDNYPRFLIIESTEKENPIASQSEFLISKFIENIVGKSYEAKKQRTGEALVEVNTQQQATILTQTRMAERDIRVAPLRSLNSSQGVISDTDLVNQTEAHLLESLNDQGVMAVRRITNGTDNKQIPIKHIILTFDQSTLP